LSRRTLQNRRQVLLQEPLGRYVSACARKSVVGEHCGARFSAGLAHKITERDRGLDKNTAGEGESNPLLPYKYRLWRSGRRRTSQALPLALPRPNTREFHVVASFMWWPVSCGGRALWSASGERAQDHAHTPAGDIMCIRGPLGRG